MFFIEISIYYAVLDEQAVEDLQPRLGESFAPINVFIQDNGRTDYNVRDVLEKATNQSNTEPVVFLYNILVDTRNPRYEESISQLRTKEGFVDCYQCGNVDSNKAILRMKVVVKDRMKHLLKGEYSKMYKENEFDALLRNRALHERYRVWTKEGKDEIHKSLQVLMKTQEALDALVERLGITDSSIIDLMASRELDEMYNVEKESINSQLV
jgi:Trp operon repressor